MIPLIGISLLVDLAIHTGLRRSELANLKVGDIDLERQLLIVRQGKGSKDRVIPLSNSTCEKLAVYIKGKEKDISLFGLVPASISGKIRTFATKAGVKLHAHSLRDYFATSLSEKGATIREIQSLLGHTNLAHTERYTLHTDKHLKAAIDLIDQEPRGKAVPSEIVSRESQQPPIIIIKIIEKKSWADYDRVLRSDYFSHFIARNEGQNPLVEIEISLFDVENNLLEIHKESVLGVKEEFIFKTMGVLAEGSYNIICQYKGIFKQGINQTLLPFKLKKASKQGEVYVIPGKLEFTNLIT